MLGYVRTRVAEGFPNAVHDVVAESRPSAQDYRYDVVFFNPASNTRQASALRVVNRSETQAAVTITGTDDAGEPGEGEGLDGMLGDGTGKWRLGVASEPMRDPARQSPERLPGCVDDEPLALDFVWLGGKVPMSGRSP